MAENTQKPKSYKLQMLASMSIAAYMGLLVFILSDFAKKLEPVDSILQTQNSVMACLNDIKAHLAFSEGRTARAHVNTLGLIAPPNSSREAISNSKLPVWPEATQAERDSTATGRSVSTTTNAIGKQASVRHAQEPREDRKGAQSIPLGQYAILSSHDLMIRTQRKTNGHGSKINGSGTLPIKSLPRGGCAPRSHC